MAACEAAVKACELTRDWPNDRPVEPRPGKSPSGRTKHRPGKVEPQDVAVIVYIVSAIDRSTGECARHYDTIAKGCGMSRGAVGRSIERLVDAGIIDRAARFARNRAQIATAFTIGTKVTDAIARRPRPACGTPPSHERDTKLSSRNFLNPVGSGPAKVARKKEGADKKASSMTQHDAAADWSGHADWLATAGQYAKRWGFGAEGLAHDDLDGWRREKGDRAILKAITTAKATGLHGERLCDFLEHTWPMNGGRTNDRGQGAQPLGGEAAPSGVELEEGGRRIGCDGRRARAAG